MGGLRVLGGKFERGWQSLLDECSPPVRALRPWLSCLWVPQVFTPFSGYRSITGASHVTFAMSDWSKLGLDLDFDPPISKVKLGTW